MACDLHGSWADYGACLTLDQPVDVASLDELTAFYRERGRPPRLQTTPYQHETLFEALATSGFTLYERETVLWRQAEHASDRQRVDGLVFDKVDATDPIAVQAFVDSQARGFFADAPFPEGMKPITERVLSMTRCHFWLLRLNGKVVGSGGLELFESCAVFIAGTVVPEARRRGLHRAFMAHRMRRARELGASYVTVGSTPGGPTERNALREGFRVAYTQLGFEQRTGLSAPE